MSNYLVLFDNKFEIKKNKLLYYLYDCMEVATKNEGENFIYNFTELYRLPIFKTLLDTILTEAKNKKAKFIVRPLRNWDRVAGHCETKFLENFDKNLIGEESRFSSGFFSKNYTIVIKKITPEIIIHEIGHAIEHISGINIEENFRKNFGLDMQTWNCNNLSFDACIKDVMQKQLKAYPIENIMGELFARFFEVLAMVKEVGGWGSYQFTYLDASKFFCNTIKWFQDYLETILLNKIDKDVSLSSTELVNNLEPYKKLWTNKVRSKFNDTDNPNLTNKFQQIINNEEISKEKLLNEFKETMNNIPSDRIEKLDNGVEFITFKKK